MGKHYVPQHLLGGFANSGKIWAFDSSTGASFCTSTVNVAHENNLWPDELETDLAYKVEGPANAIIDRARRGQLPTLSEREIFSNYVIVLMRRVPRARARALNLVPAMAESLKQEFRNEVSDYVEKNPQDATKAAELVEMAERRLEEFATRPDSRFWHPTIIESVSPQLSSALCSMTWRLLVSERNQFLLGDCPVFFHEGIGLGNPLSELTFPLSSNVAFWASRSVKGNDCVLNAKPSAVREINRRTATNSTRFVFARTPEDWIQPFLAQGKWALNRLT